MKRWANSGLVAARGIAMLSSQTIVPVGGNDAVSVGAVAGAMVSVHVLIGIGEGIITGLAVGAVMAMRPDLVHGARGRLPVLELRTPEPVA